jgi:hypothetical protein
MESSSGEKPDHRTSSTTEGQSTQSTGEPPVKTLSKCLAPFKKTHGSIVQGILNHHGTQGDLRDVALSHSLEELAALTDDASGEPADHLSQGTDKKGKASGKAAGHRDVAASTQPRPQTFVAARAFRKDLFQNEPTGVLQRMTMDREIYSSANESTRNGVVQFLHNQPRDFNIRQDSILSALRHANAFAGIPPSDHQAVSDSVKALQTTQAIVDDPETIQPLMDAGLNTAFAVSSMPEASFVRTIKGKVDSAQARATLGFETITLWFRYCKLLVERGLQQSITEPVCSNENKR